MAGKFYWLKLEEDFFQTEEVEWLEEQENGKEYVLFYLKLCLKMLKTDGELIRKVGKITIEYTSKKLAELTNTDVEIVEKAMELFNQIGLIETSEKGNVRLPRISSMIGSLSESKEAVKKREYRSKAKGQHVPEAKGQHVPEAKGQHVPEAKGQHVPEAKGQHVRQSIEYRDKSIEIREDDYHHLHKGDDDKKSLDIFLLWEKNIMPLAPLVGEKLKALNAEVGEAAVEYAISAAVEHGARNFSYVQTVARNYASGNVQKPQKEQMPF